MFQALGDSILAGLGATVPSATWVRRLDPLNSGVSGAQAAEVANQALTVAPAAGAAYVVAVGTNDVWKYGDDPVKKEYFRKCLTAAVGWLSLPIKTIARGMAQSGPPWRNGTANTIGLACATNGSKLAGSVAGPRLVVGYTIQDFHLTKGTMAVKVNGSTVGTISNDGQGMTTHLGSGNPYFFGAAASVFNTGLGVGVTGAVEIVVTSADGMYVYLDWIASGQQTQPRVAVGNVTKWTPARYSQHGRTQQTIEAYNAIIASVAANFPNARLVNNFAAIDPALHLADTVHWNDAGHAIGAANFRAAILD